MELIACICSFEKCWNAFDSKAFFYLILIFIHTGVDSVTSMSSIMTTMSGKCMLSEEARIPPS